jgi:hypothetical protein
MADQVLIARGDLDGKAPRCHPGHPRDPSDLRHEHTDDQHGNTDPAQIAGVACKGLATTWDGVIGGIKAGQTL